MGAIDVWLDADPGHDDAIAILLALHTPGVNLLGISSVHGNGSLKHTTENAARLLCSFGSPDQVARVPVVAGASKPLIRHTKHDTEIHGVDGLSGVEGLLGPDDENVKRKIAESESVNAVEAMVKAARDLSAATHGVGRLAIVATGTLTNVALFVATYPDVVRDCVSQIVLMGGAEGRGNRSPTAEFNILCDPEAAQIVFDSEVPCVMVPLNVTHTALFTPTLNSALLKATPTSEFSTMASTQLRHTLATLLMFFAATYEKVFGFNNGPPVHDPLCIAYLTHPHLFKGKRYRVDVEMQGKHTAGTTVIDLYDYRTSQVKWDPTAEPLTAWIQDPESPASWGAHGKNVWVAEELDVAGFWDVFMDAVDTADKVCALNGHVHP